MKEEITLVDLPDEGWEERAVRGYELNAWVICPRKCWFLPVASARAARHATA